MFGIRINAVVDPTEQFMVSIYFVVMLDGANSDTVLVYANKYNGIKSEIENLKTNEFKQVRTGIGRPPAVIDDRSYDVGDRICAEQVYIKRNV
ncbi:hypothetical protein G6F42_015389 [Rhizopus arrhizus]|nr:hypothetical protein G6F42_015389 [Rhizopus arrhizus]